MAKPFMVRLHPVVRQQLEELSEQNFTTMTQEVVEAIKDRLKQAGLWPPPPQEQPKSHGKPKPHHGGEG